MSAFNTPPDMYGGPGAQITGTWYNKRTGQSITVRDSFIDGEGMQIMTSNGALISGDEFSRDYIQVDNTVYDFDGKPTDEKDQIDYEEMFSHSTQVDYSAQVFPKQETFSAPTTTTPQPKQGDMKYQMLSKLFDKLTDTPSLDVNVIWNSIPVSELNMLKSFFDLTDEDISDYIYEHYCTDVEIKAAITSAVKRML